MRQSFEFQRLYLTLLSGRASGVENLRHLPPKDSLLGEDISAGQLRAKLTCVEVGLICWLVEAHSCARVFILVVVDVQPRLLHSNTPT